MGPEVRAARLAAAQHLCISLAQAMECGMSDDAVYRLVKKGLWRRRLPGVYVITAAGSTWRQDLMAAQLWLGESAAVSGPSAAALWRMPGFSEGPIELTTTGCRQSSHGITVRRMKALPGHEVGLIGALRVTTPARTLLDLSGTCDAEKFEIVFHDSLCRRLISLHRMRRISSRYAGPGAVGAPLLRELLTIYRDDPTPAESPLEVFARRAIAKAKLPDPVRQHPVVVNGRRYRIDLAYPVPMIAIEVDGYRWHSSRLDWDRDKEKAKALRRVGWTVIEGRYASVRIDPSTFIDEIAEALGARLPFVSKEPRTARVSAQGK